MNLFYFNTCLPDIHDNNLIVNCFSKTYTEYNNLRKKYPNEIDGIVTKCDSTESYLNTLRFSIADCIKGLEKSLRVNAYRVFLKYPFYSNFIEVDENAMIENEYTITVDRDAKEAYFEKVVADNSGLAFTLALSKDLKTHPLIINGGDGSATPFLNLFGEPKNTIQIEDIIVQSMRAKMPNFDKLLNIVGRNNHSSKFKNGFDKLSSEIQHIIIAHFEKAIKRDGVTPFCPDDDLIKDVTPEDEHEIRISELRVFNPIAFRIYFYESEKKIYLASIEKKPLKDKKTREQDNHIKSAKSTIKQMLILKK